VFYEGLMPDRERFYAALTADRLNVPTKFIKADDYRIILDPRDLSDTQPIEEPLANLWKDSLRSCVATSHVVLTGFGGDAIFRESTSRLAKLAGSGRIIGALIEAVQYVRWHQRMPRPGIRTMLQKTRNRRFTWDAPPVWLNPDFRKRIGADERWSELISPPETTHRTRPEVEFNLIGSFWTRLFEEYHPTETGLPLEHRHPFFDLRVLRFVLSVPPAQWYNDKGLLRIGMVNRLPIEVVRREKSPLAYDPLEVRWKRDGSGWIDGATIGDNIRGFVDKDYVWKDVGGNAADPPPGYRFNFRPLMLSRWLEKKWVA
jgi:asparagine synthase (glutamine-hydrolysing)